MIKKYGRVLSLLWVIGHVCAAIPIGNIRTNEKSRISQISQHHVSYPSVSLSNPSQRNTKKSDMPEKGQIKFMKTLLGKVKTLLHRNDQGKKDKSDEKKIAPDKIPEKISAVATDNDKLYGVLGGSKENDDENSVNVISIPLKALQKVAKIEPKDGDHAGVKDSGDLKYTSKGTQVLLRPVSVKLRHKNPYLPVFFQNHPPSLEVVKSNKFLPDGPNDELYETPRVPLERHGGISRYSKGDLGLYRDIGHIPGEIRYHHDPSEDRDILGATSLRHKSPVGYHHSKDDDDDDGVDDDDDDMGDDDDDFGDDDEDDDDDGDQFDYKNSPRMRAEERRIAATRKRLYDMLPGNDPTYTSENRGLGLPVRPPGMMQMPEAFLGNPMVRPGVGFNQRNLMPSTGAALAGEHADNANDRNVFMFGRGGSRQVFGNSDADFRGSRMGPGSMRVNSRGFTLGGSHAQALSPNEVSYLLQKPGFPSLSQKDKISRPENSRHKARGVLLKVNGHPIGESKDLRDHIVNDVVYKGKEKVIKSKGAMDVKVSKATDGVHSKVVDITSAEKVKVLEEKSKIPKGE